MSETDCRRFEGRLADYGRGLLRPEEAAALRDHVWACASCSGKLRDFPALFARLPEEEFDLAPRIVARLRATPAAGGAMGRFRWALAWAAAASFVVALGAFALRGRPVEVASRSASPASPDPVPAILPASPSGPAVAGMRLELARGEVRVGAMRHEARAGRPVSVAIPVGEPVDSGSARAWLVRGRARIALASARIVPGPRAVAVERGRVSVHVERPGAPGAVVFTTGLAEVVATGTRFALDVGPAGVGVELLEGSLDVTRRAVPGEAAITLAGPQGVVVTGASTRPSPAPLALAALSRMVSEFAELEGVGRDTMLSIVAGAWRAGASGEPGVRAVDGIVRALARGFEPAPRASRAPAAPKPSGAAGPSPSAPVEPDLAVEIQGVTSERSPSPPPVQR